MRQDDVSTTGQRVGQESFRFRLPLRTQSSPAPRKPTWRFENDGSERLLALACHVCHSVAELVRYALRNQIIEA